MLESMKKDNETINQIYKGEELVWELPMVMMSRIDLMAGFDTIKFTTYPARCNVVVTINNKEVANSRSTSSGLFTCSVNPPLKSGDFVTIEITKSGWADFENFYSVY